MMTEYVEHLQGVDLSALDPEMKMCFFINIFNALYVHTWVFSANQPAQEYPVAFTRPTCTMLGACTSA